MMQTGSRDSWTVGLQTGGSTNATSESQGSCSNSRPKVKEKISKGKTPVKLCCCSGKKCHIIKLGLQNAEGLSLSPLFSLPLLALTHMCVLPPCGHHLCSVKHTPASVDPHDFSKDCVSAVGFYTDHCKITV